MLRWEALDSFPNILSFQCLYLFITARTHLPYSHIHPCDSKHTADVVSQCSSPVCRNVYRNLLDKPHTTGYILLFFTFQGTWSLSAQYTTKCTLNLKCILFHHCFENDSDSLYMVIWIRMAYIGSYIWMFGH